MFEEIKKLISDQLRIDPARIEESTNLVDDLGVDSLDVAEMLMTIEDKYGVAVPDEDAIKLKTVKDITDYITANR